MSESLATALRTDYFITMKAIAKPKSPARRAASVKGDIARAMFARWEKDHVDPQPMSWPKFKATMEANRLRSTPLFSK